MGLAVQSWPKLAGYLRITSRKFNALPNTETIVQKNIDCERHGSEVQRAAAAGQLQDRAALADFVISPIGAAAFRKSVHQSDAGAAAAACAISRMRSCSERTRRSAAVRRRAISAATANALNPDRKRDSRHISISMRSLSSLIAPQNNRSAAGPLKQKIPIAYKPIPGGGR